MKKSKKDQIIDKATELFMNNGILATSMDDIATSVPAAKMTIYNYFGSKDKLLYEVLFRYIRSMHERMTRLIAESPDPLSALQAILSYKEMQIPENFLKECLEHDPQVASQMIVDYHRHVAGEFEKFIFDGQRSGHIRKDISPFVLNLCVAAIKSYLTRPDIAGQIGDFKSIGEQINTLILYGIVSPEHNQKRME